MIGSEALSRWEPFNAAAQRGRLLEFAAALGSRDSALRRDECGDPRIIGGAWGYAKKAMSFAKVTQDGDEEGCRLRARRKRSATRSAFIRSGR